VRSSSRRVHALAATANAAPKTNHQNNRDIFLLKHMLVIFVVFMLGWLPYYTLEIAGLTAKMPYWELKTLEILPVLSSIIILVDLFVYNHELRQYLKEKLLKLFH